MPRNSPTRPSRRADGSSEGSSAASNCAGEEKSTTVAIRLRPLNEREKAGNQSRIWRCVPTHNSVTQTSPDGNPLPDAKGSTFFTYDRIFDEDSSTEQVYEGVAREIVHSVVRGLNGTIFAYGQTSSGKTFTMQGGDNSQTPGIVQMAARDLFNLMDQTPERQFLMRVSYLEIYQEEIRDLLNLESSKLQVREDPRKGVYIEAHEEVVSGFDNVLQILNHGEKQRHVGFTEMNSRSSRSHTLFRLVVESQEHFTAGVHASEDDVDQAVLVATLNLVDLAGSESVRHTGATGQRQKEGGKINQSLLTLSRVIQTLSQGGHAHVNYRDSKLTRILQPSLSGNAGMAIICCATAAEGFLEETRSTLQFASRAKNIKTNAIVNEVLDDKAQLKRMSQELHELRRQQAEGGRGSALVETLQAEKAKQAEQIARLHNLIINCGGGAAAVAAADESVGDEVLLDASPRYRRTKRSRETWCPGESGVPLPLNLLDPNRRGTTIDEEGSDHLRKRASVGTPSSKVRLSSSSPCTPFVSGGGMPMMTLDVMSPARARAEQQVNEMRERLMAVQEERDGLAAKAEEVEARGARVGELEVEVSALKERLVAASQAAAAAAAAEVAQTSDNASEMAVIAAKLEDALKAKEVLEVELTEFGEYTDMRDQEMVEIKERMAIAEEGLHRKEAELAAIRAAEELAEREKEEGMDTEGDAAEKMEEVTALNNALEQCQKDLAENIARANGAEEEISRLAQEVGSERARVAEQQEAAERAAREVDAVGATANKAVEAVDMRREEVEADFQQRLSSLGAEKAALQEEKEVLEEEKAVLQEEKAVLEEDKAVLHDQGVELRELNDIAAGLLAEHEVKQPSTADADAQTEVDFDALVPSEEADRAKQAVADAQVEIAERDRTLADHQGRLKELEGSLAQAKAEQQALEIRSKEEKEGADARLIEALTSQRRAEEALGATYQSQLEMRCRLEDAMEQINGAEAARADMAEAGSVARMKEEEIAALEKRLAEQDLCLQTAREEEVSASTLAEEANSAAADAMEEAREARRQLAELTEASEAKDATISEFVTLVEGFEKEREKVSQLEQQLKEAQDSNEKLVSAREGNEARVSELEQELAAAEARNEFLHANAAACSKAEVDARVEELSEELAARVVEVVAARAEVVAMKAAASTAEIKAIEEAAQREEASLKESSTARAALEASEAEITCLVNAAEVSAEKAAALQSEVEARTQEVVALTAAAESLKSSEEASLNELSMARAGFEASKSEIAKLVDAAEVSTKEAVVLQSEVEAKTQEIASLAAAAKSFESGEEASLDELSTTRATLEAREAEIARLVDVAEAATEKAAALQSEVDAKAQEVVALTATAESFESGEEASLRELSTARAALEVAEAEIARLAEAAEVSTEKAAVLQSEVEAKTQEIASLTAAAESFESREEASLDELSTARVALEASKAEISRVVDAAEVSTKEAAVLQSEVEAKTQEIASLTAAAKSFKSGEEASLDELSMARVTLEAREAEIARLIDAAEAATEKAATLQSEVDAKTQEVVALTATAESFESGEEASLRELSTAHAALEVAEAEIARLSEAAEVSTEKAAVLQSEVEAKTQKIASLTAAAESFEAREEASLDELSTARVALEASKAEISRVVDAAEVSTKEAAVLQSEVEAKTQEIASLTAAAKSFKSGEEASLDELSTARVTLEAREAEITRLIDAAEVATEKVAALQSEVDAKTQEVVALTATAESFESGEEASLGELSTARAALEVAEAEIARLAEAAEVSTEKVAALQSEVEAKTQEVVSLAAAAESFKSREEASLDELSTSRAALEAGEAEIAVLIGAAEVCGEQAAALQSEVEAKTQEIVLLTAAAESFESREEASLNELSTARATLEASKAEIARLVDAAEVHSKEAAVLQSEVEAKTQEVVTLTAATESLGALEKASLNELSMARDALDARENECARIVDAAEVSAEQAAALQAEVEAKTREVVALTAATESLESRVENSLAELSTAHAALESSKIEIARLVDAAKVSTEQANTLQADVDIKIQEIGSLTAAVESLESRVEDVEAVASEREAAGASRIAELEGQLATASDQLEEALAAAEKTASEANVLAETTELVETLSAELETAHKGLTEREREMAEASAVSETETNDMRSALEEMEASLVGKEEELARLREQVAEQLREAQAAAATSAAAVLGNDALIAEMKERLEVKDAIENELTQALEDSENSTKEVLDLTDQLMEKEARLSAQAVTIAELQEQIEAGTAELEALRSSASSIATAHTDGLEGQAEDSLVLRRLRVELDKKSSEVDTALKEAAAVRGELREMKGMLSKAEAGADAAGADEDSLRKRLSQLVCENGLLKGEKERREALAAAAAVESKSSSSRNAVEIEHLKKEIKQLKERADKASGAAADGDRAKVALQAMEFKLAEVLRERADLQDAVQRSIDRCTEADNEAENLRTRFAEMEQILEKSANRNTLAALETKVDELEEDSRRAAASKVDMEVEARQAENRAERLRGEVELIRSEYEVVSEEAVGLRGSLAAAEAKLEEAMVLPAPEPFEDHTEAMEAEIARLMQELVEMQSSRDEALRSLEAAVSRAQETAERSEAQSKAMEGQLRYRLEAQVAEAENLRHELSAAREHMEKAAAAARDSEQQTREGDNSKKAAILEEMETLMEQKLCAENTAKGMEQELGKLREEVAGADKRASHDQSRIILSSKKHIATLEEVIAAKDRSLAELQGSLMAAREAETAGTSATAELVQKAEAVAASDIASLTKQIEAGKALLKEKDARIARLTSVRLTVDQVEKLRVLRERATNAAAENRELKGKVAKLEKCNKQLLEKLQQYGKRVRELSKEHGVVRAAVEEVGISVSDGRGLGDAVRELAERSSGIDLSMMSSFSGGEAAAVAAAVATSERHYDELQEAKAGLKKQESERLGLQEQMRAGVERFRELEAKEASVRERLEQTESDTRQKLKMQEKDHERRLQFLQEENVNLYEENKDVRAKADKLKVEVQTLQEKATAAQTAPPPGSSTKKRAFVDRTNLPVEAAIVGKPVATAPPTSAAERRTRSRAILQGPPIEDEEGGECNQS